PCDDPADHRDGDRHHGHAAEQRAGAGRGWLRGKHSDGDCRPAAPVRPARRGGEAVSFQRSAISFQQEEYRERWLVADG
ncbi:MAG: hypothetical protein WBF17_21930, partial [Phycisphaerae bacterium]